MTQPLDSEAVRRDDELLDALAFGELVDAYDDDETAQLLLGWRDDIVHSPVVVARQSPTPAGRPLGLSRRVCVAAAVGVIAAGSIGSVAAASVAEPGSPLWPITRVVYTERAQSLEARESALSNLKKAQQAAAKRKPDEAKHLLDEALKQADLVRPGDDRAGLKSQVRQVLATIQSPTGSPAASASPPRVFPTPDASPAPPPVQPAPSDPAPVPSTQPSPLVLTPSPTDSPAPQPDPTSPPADPGAGLSSVPAPISQ
jgi:hypothetical protein